MPGRFLVFMPTVDHVGVSRKIESREERSRLRGIVREFREQTGFSGGLIIRTAAANRPKDDIVSDLSYFHKVWTEIRHKAETSKAPAVVYQEQSLVAKLLRDSADRGVLRDSHRQRTRTSARAGTDRAHHAVARAEGEAVREGIPDLRGVRRSG
jgi:Rne/Rng family ribonuclease